MAMMNEVHHMDRERSERRRAKEKGNSTGRKGLLLDCGRDVEQPPDRLGVLTGGREIPDGDVHRMQTRHWHQRSQKRAREIELKCLYADQIVSTRTNFCRKIFTFREVYSSYLDAGVRMRAKWLRLKFVFCFFILLIF